MYVSSVIFREESFTILEKNEFPFQPPPKAGQGRLAAAGSAGYRPAYPRAVYRARAVREIPKNFRRLALAHQKTQFFDDLIYLSKLFPRFTKFCCIFARNRDTINKHPLFD